MVNDSIDYLTYVLCIISCIEDDLTRAYHSSFEIAS